MRRASGSFLVGVALVGLLLAACGGGAAAPSASAPSSAAAASSAAPVVVQGIDANKTITVGAFLAQSGPLASVAAAGYGVQMYFDSVNAKGGVNGYKLSYKPVDDAADPTKTVTVVRQLWEQDKVFALLLPYGSSSNTAAKKYILDNKIPTLFPWSNSTIYFGTDGATVPPDVFGFAAPYLPEVQALTDFAGKQKSIKKIAILHTTDEYGQAGVDGTSKTAKALGLSVVGDFGYDTTETNFAPLGQRVANSGAEATIVWAIPGAANAVAAAEAAGYKGIWLLGDAFRGGANLAALVKTPNLGGRTYLIFHQKTVAQMTAAGSDFVTQLKVKYPNADPDPAIVGWTLAAMFVQGVKETTADGKQLTWDRLRSTFETWNNRTIEAAVGIGYSGKSHVGAEQAQILALQTDNTWKVAQDFTPLPK